MVVRHLLYFIFVNFISTIFINKTWCFPFYYYTDACSMAQSCPTFSTPWTIAHQVQPLCGILQARILKWVAISFFKTFTLISRLLRAAWGSSFPGISGKEWSTQSHSHRSSWLLEEVRSTLKVQPEGKGDRQYSFCTLYYKRDKCT